MGRAARIVVIATALGLVAGAFVGAIVSRMYWGYYLHRPPVFKEVAAAREVRAVTGVRSAAGRSCRDLEIDPSYSAQERMHYALQDSYYAHEGRLLLALSQRGLSPEAAPSDAGLPVSDLILQLRERGELVAGDRGYDRATCLSGAAVEVLDAAGSSALILGLHGRQVSNDHYPYYEASFRKAPDVWRLDRVQRYFYDVAGMEGAEGPRLLALFAILVSAPVSAGAMVVVSIARARDRRRRTSA